MITLAIYIGSVTTKVAAIRDGEILSAKIIMSGYNVQKAGENVFEGIVSELEFRPSSIESVVTTGYGRNSVNIGAALIGMISQQ